MSNGISPEHLPALLAMLLVVPVAFLARRLPGYAAAGALTRLAAALLAATGFAHLGLVLTHLDERLTAALFAIAGGLFLALSGAAFSWHWWRPAAAALLVATLAAYLLYLGAGWEAVDQAGIAIKIVELFALGLILVPESPGQGWRRRLRWTAATVGLLFVTTLAGLIPWAASIRQVARGPHGAAGNPVTVVQVVPGPVTDADRVAAERFMAATRAAIQKYQDLDAALADGYRGGAPGEPVSHHLNPARVPGDGRLDPQRPPGLVYAHTHHGPLLLGAFFIMPRAGMRGPDIAGPLTEWHYHTNICVAPVTGVLASLNSPFRECPLGSVAITSPAMLHVWIVDNPRGPFAHDLDPAYLQRLLEH